jgi:hypothetical protein
MNNCSTFEDHGGVLDFPCGVERLPCGNTLITDAGAESGSGSEIIEVDKNGDVVRTTDLGFRFAHTAKRLANGNTLVADTSNNRILEFDSNDRIVFTSEDWGGGTGQLSDGSVLDYPNNVEVLDERRILVTNRNANNFIIVDRAGTLIERSMCKLKHPHNCAPLANGNILIADSDENRVREVDVDGCTVWEYADGLNWPRDANRLLNGNTLIADSKNSRVIEVTPDGVIAWEFAVDYFANFYEAHRLPTGSTLISDQQHKRVFEVSPTGEIIWEFRNFRRDQPVFEKLQNGFFRHWNSAGTPEAWHLATRFSEGGGTFVLGEDAYGKPVPGMTYDRDGALCFQQTIRVTPGEKRTFGGSLRTEGLDGFTCLQVAFEDEFDGLLCDASLSPKGTPFSGDSDWVQDSLDVIVPPKAVYAILRIFLSGHGRVFFKELRWNASLA